MKIVYATTCSRILFTKWQIMLEKDKHDCHCPTLIDGILYVTESCFQKHNVLCISAFHTNAGYRFLGEILPYNSNLAQTTFDLTRPCLSFGLEQSNEIAIIGD